MKEVIVTTQAELDAIPENYDGHIIICCQELVTVSKRYLYAVQVYGNSSVEALEYSSVSAHDNSLVYAYGKSRVYAYDNSRVEAYVNSFVYACDKSTVYARDNSSVNAFENSRVVAYDNSKVTFHGSAGGNKLDLEEQSGYISKETVREILQELYDQVDEKTPKWVETQIKMKAKQFGVEIKERKDAR